jgi:hypothetical protein
MSSDRGPAVTGPQVATVNLANETVALDEVLRRLVVDLAAIDRETARYHRKLCGEEPWTTFEAPLLRHNPPVVPPAYPDRARSYGSP